MLASTVSSARSLVSYPAPNLLEGGDDAVDAVARGATDSCRMTSPWQHIMSMRIIWQNGESDTPTCKMRCTHPLFNRCHDNTKLAGHGPARYKMEWIYMRTKVSGSDSLELALEMKKKERKKERKKD